MNILATLTIIALLCIVAFILHKCWLSIDSFEYTHKYGNKLLEDIENTKIAHQNIIPETLSRSVISCLRGDVERLKERFDGLNLNFIKYRQTILLKKGETDVIVLECLLWKIHSEITKLQKSTENLTAE